MWGSKRRERNTEQAPLAMDFQSAVKAAKNRASTAELLARLAQHSSFSVRLEVAGNPSTSPGDLARLAQDSHAEVRLRVAGNPTTTGSVLDNLADPPDGPLLEISLQNPSGTKQADDFTIRSVRARVAGNPKAPQSTLARLVSAGFANEVAENEGAPGDLLRLLADQALQIYDNETPAWEMQDQLRTLRDLASNPATPADILDSIAGRSWQREVAENPSTSGATLARLADLCALDSTLPEAALALARNPNLPPEGVRSLARSQSPLVRNALAEWHSG